MRGLRSINLLQSHNLDPKIRWKADEEERMAPAGFQCLILYSNFFFVFLLFFYFYCCPVTFLIAQ